MKAKNYFLVLVLFCQYFSFGREVSAPTLPIITRVLNLVPPTAPIAAPQTFCTTATVADLVAEGTSLKWYDVATNGTALEATTVLTSKSYYVTQTIDAQESARTEVSVTIIQLGTPVSTAAVGNPGSYFFLNVPITGVTSNLTYQWQKFSNDSWQDILDAETASSTYMLSESGTLGSVTDYRLQVTNTVTGVICYSATISHTLGLVYCNTGSNNTEILRILNFTLGDINNNSTSLSGYEDFTSLSTNVERGEEYNFSITTTIIEEPSYADGWVYIDYNHNGTFDDGERGYLWYSQNGIISYPMTIPNDALLGPTRMRILTRIQFGSSYLPCVNLDYGQVEDYTINIVPTAPTAAAQSFCTTATVADLVATGTSLKWYDVATNGTPLEATTVLTTTTYYVSQTIEGIESARTAVSVTLIQLGTPVSTATIGNPGSLFYVNVPITGSTSNLTYQWQKFTDNSWQDMLDAQTTPSSAITAESGALGTVTDYRLQVTNSITGVICYSATVSYTIGLVYCAASSDDTEIVRILNFNLGDINNTSTSLSGYEDFTSLSTNVVRGEEYTFTITTPVVEDPLHADGWIWIDYNHNGTFDAGERVFAGYTINGMVMQSFTIPNDALLGPTRIRVLSRLAFASSFLPCGTAQYGQYEDYTLNIIACPVGVFTGITNSDWHTASNWCGNIIPVASSEVIVATSNPLVISSDVTIASLTVGANANVTVNAALTVGNITVDTEGQLIVANDAVVLQTETATNTGSVIVKRNATPLFRQDYTLWSSPVFEPNLRSFSPQTLYNRFYTYGFTTSENGAYIQELFTTEDVATKKFELGKGYLIRMPNNATEYGGLVIPESFQGVFSGKLNNGEITFPLIGKVLGTSNGLNLVGNPYPSPVSIASFLAANTTILPTLYFWKKLASANPDNTSSGYATLNTLGFVFSDPNIPAPTHIQTGQAFFVTAINATPGNLVFNNSMRSNATSTFFKTGSTLNETHRLWLNLSSDTVDVGQTLIGYTTQATQGVDSGLDALYFNDSPTALTSLIENKEYIIQGRSLPFVNTDIVPLGFKTNVAGDFTISLTNFDGLFASNQDVFLKDKTTNTLHNLKTASYTFTAPVGIFNDRFEVQYDGTLGTNNPAFDTNNILVAVNNQKIKINAGNVMMEKIELIDVSGRVIFTLENVNTTTAIIENVPMSAQMLIVRITTAENGIVNKKIVF